MLAEWENENGIRVLGLVEMDWETLYQDWGTRLKEHMGEAAYNTASFLSGSKSGRGMVIWANKDLEAVGLCPKDCVSLEAGNDLQISDQTGIVYEEWMCSLP